uniref:Arginyl-tRNA--protein transferase 1 n=1 Tax=Petromyzon marinus TaxID=7757 RepID=S4RIW0_PETMA
ETMSTLGMHSVVEYLSHSGGNSCGYCGGETSSVSHGMWAHALTVHDYQDLVDRGWRRSGEYLYKPIMDKTCCPQYTIRCQVLDYRLSKSQKKILKRMTMYLANGDICKGKHYDLHLKTSIFPQSYPDVAIITSIFPLCQKEGFAEDIWSIVRREGKEAPQTCPKKTCIMDYIFDESLLEGILYHNHEYHTFWSTGVGADPSRPMARKAKDLRRERRMLKQQKQGGMESGDQASGRQAGQHPEQQAPNQPKTLEDFVSEHKAGDGKHKLEVRLVRSSPPSSEFLASFPVSYLLYKRYQVVVHKDPPSRPSQEQFKRFLCNSPLKKKTRPSSPDVGYGSFHQQYWLDGRLIAVGVLDILPRCLSSVYLYYDPDFAFLSMGIYSALREVAFTRQLYTQAPALRYYYMGFYIHSCPKMRYK